jgi:hypothetical protein
METLVAVVLAPLVALVAVALAALPAPIIVALVALPPFHSHAMVVRFPLLSSILSLYTYTVLFREASSHVVELVLKNITPWSNTMVVVGSLCPRDSKIIVAFSPASVVMAIVPF